MSGGRSDPGGGPRPDADDLGTYHAPATTALVPEKPQFTPAHPDLARSIAEALDISGTVDEIGGGPAARFFRVTTADGRRLFVKRVALANLGSQRAGDELAHWLRARGLPTIGTNLQAPAADGSGDVFFAYPYLEWRPLRADEADLAALGTALAKLHAALLEHPSVPAWRQNTERRTARLFEIRRKLADGQLESRVHVSRVKEICRRKGAGFAPAEPSQPLHGDLHLFNLLVPTERNSGPVFIDFEDVRHSVLPLRFELALVIERAILNQVEDDSAAARLADLFLHSYFAGDPREVERIKPKMPETLLALSLRSLCVLVDGEQSGIEVDAAEWDKFIALYAEAERRAGIFA